MEHKYLRSGDMPFYEYEQYFKGDVYIFNKNTTKFHTSKIKYYTQAKYDVDYCVIVKINSNIYGLTSFKLVIRSDNNYDYNDWSIIFDFLYKLRDLFYVFNLFELVGYIIKQTPVVYYLEYLKEICIRQNIPHIRSRAFSFNFIDKLVKDFENEREKTKKGILP